jgi:MFS family permease
MVEAKFTAERMVALEAPTDKVPSSPDVEKLPELELVESNPYGSRPKCFSNLLQECLFVLTTTFAIGQSSIFFGAAICITSYIGNDLNMTASEVVWISAGQNLSAGCFLLFFGRVAAVPPAIGKLGAVYEKPSRRKNRAFACFSAGNPLGFALGAFIAGVAMDVANWRTVFVSTLILPNIYQCMCITRPGEAPEGKIISILLGISGALPVLAQFNSD